MNKAAVLTFFLLLQAGLSGTQAFAAGDAEAGGKLFKRVCGGCHQIGESARAFFGPQLNGIIGRTAGSTTDYQYSDAMKSSGVVWTREKLAAYIEDPKAVVSGTRMIFWGISDQEKIDDLLAYLQTFPAQ
ncbi:c-type cytochrome [Pseudomonas moorei]|jgi:cytochrome c|uniref:Cytochrome c n=1 Tax=Pseudomonas moorei TaxID=395599 RepID=A0A1H1GHB3_9PSED|nr:cytochrome c family protein [Pseudomonas moorei]KAB0502902.1 cytochrome c family protein [Pseudomonas moorei]PPA01962.1 cytochrome c family protein [Pseudomonas sp. MWU12-2312b]SDR12236.1 cytochrome c [Pseudomonas moorei]